MVFGGDFDVFGGRFGGSCEREYRETRIEATEEFNTRRGR